MMFSPRITISPISPGSPRPAVGSSASSSAGRANSTPADRGAHRARLGRPVGVVERGDRRGLRQPVALEQRKPERLLDPAQHLDGQRGAAGGADPEGAGVEAVRGRLDGEQGHVHRRHAEEDRHPVPLRRREGLLRRRTSAAGSGRRRRPSRRSGRRSDRTSGTAAARRTARRPGPLRQQRLDAWSATLVRRLAWVSSAPFGLAGGARGVEDDRGVLGGRARPRSVGRARSPASCASNSPGADHDDVGAGGARPPWPPPRRTGRTPRRPRAPQSCQV